MIRFPDSPEGKIFPANPILNVYSNYLRTVAALRPLLAPV
jgi:hypothetical protein